MMNWFKDRSVPVSSWEKLSPEEREGKFAIGVLTKAQATELTEVYKQLIEQLQQRGGE
jgi:hypothetical protein